MRLLVTLFWSGLEWWHGSLAFLLTPFWRERKKFERLNVQEQCYQQSHPLADLCFHFSSEGEWEQVRYVVQKFLAQKKIIELVYTSPSVASKIKIFASQFPEQVFFVRVPLIDVFQWQQFKSWMSAPILIMVRYDFFPILMNFNHRKTLYLFWYFSPPELPVGRRLFRWFMEQLSLPIFARCLATRWQDLHILQRQAIPAFSFPMDLRIFSIQERIADKMNNFIKIFHAGKELDNFLNYQKTSRSLMVIHGNAYWEEAHYLFDPSVQENIRSGKLFLAIVPHKEDLVLGPLNEWCRKMQLNMYTIGPTTLASEFMAWKELPGIFYFTGKGYLLELYSYFGMAILGGSFSRQAHSVWEPFLNHCIILHGKKIKKSSEYYAAYELNPYAFVLTDDASALAHHLNEKFVLKHHWPKEKIIPYDQYKIQLELLMQQIVSKEIACEN